MAMDIVPPRTTRIMTWNINGTGKDKVGRLLDFIRDRAPDVLVLTEYQPLQSGGAPLCEGLKQGGWPHVCVAPHPKEGKKYNTVLIAARTSIVESGIRPDFSAHPDMQMMHARWLEVEMRLAAITQPGTDEPPTASLYITGVHIPDYKKENSATLMIKRDFWESLLAHARTRQSSRSMIIGDFNTGLRTDQSGGVALECGEYMERLASGDLGWSDVWRTGHPDKREYSWSHKRSGNGYRLDHAWVSSSQQGMQITSEYDQEGRTVSDHAALIVEIG